MERKIRRKNSYTTGEIARILGININTVIKWFDDEQLKGFRLPGSLERRVPYEALKDFMRSHNLPLELLPAPEESERGYRRAYPRKVVSLSAELAIKGSDEAVTVPVSVINLSKLGAKAEVEAGKELKIPAPPVEVSLKFAADPLDGLEVKSHLIHLNAAQKITMGLKFLEMSEEWEKKLESFLDSL
ncbi:MAG TPA: helix-turn-helix domain-containing protein [Proteobacteria bacterium]|nr:helix-turn-helix domain-containing protein [Pseudomonadota bacterium]